MPFTSMFAEMKTLLVKFWAKVAVSIDPLGTTMSGDQLLATFQYAAVAPLEGAHVALPARVVH